MRLIRRGDDHAWAQPRLSHYVEGELGWRARRRLELHAEECPDCSRGIRALRALLRLLHQSAIESETRAPAGIFDRVRRDTSGDPRDRDREEEAT
jgi:anti-sigma factor RsiW